MGDSAEFRERLAALVHIIWADWMEYLLEKCSLQEDGSVVIPKNLVRRWKRQMFSEYEELPDNERESDRYEADRIIELFEPHHALTKNK